MAFGGIKRFLRVRLGLREQARADADAEIRFHLDMRVADLVEQGMDPAAAERQAKREFGDPDRARAMLRAEAERTERRARIAAWRRDLRDDVRYGWRKLRRSPGFTAAAVLTLALGIGANTAMFSVVHAVLLRPLPYPAADRIVRVWEVSPEGTATNVVSSGNYLDWREQATVFEELGAQSWTYGQALTALDRPERVTVSRMTPSAFRALGVQPALGRWLAPEEGRSQGPAVALISQELWRTRFGGDPGLVGSAIELDEESYEVVGVMPASFDFPTPEVDVWVPLQLGEEDRQSRRAHQWYVVGRLRPDASIEAAQAEMSAIAARIAAEHPQHMQGWDANVVSYRDDLVAGARPLLLVLLGVVGAVLLLTCANLANLQLARAVGREREVAVRGALGAGRWRVVRQLLTESLQIALVGGALAILVLVVGLDALVALAPDDIPLLDDVRIDPVVVGFGLALTLFSALLFGLVPALRLGRADLVTALRTAHDGAGGVRHARLRGALLVAEVALSLILLAGAALMTRSMLRLNDVEPGFDPHGVLAVSIDVPLTRYPEPERQRAFYDALIERVRALPGVEAVAGTTEPPVVGYAMTFSFAIEGRPSPHPSGREEDELLHAVTPGFFRAMGQPLLEGRPFTNADREGAPRVVVISQTLARKHWPDESPIGARISFSGPQEGPWWRIVGVAADTRWQGLDRPARPVIYMPRAQTPWAWLSWMTLMIRTDGEPAALAPAVRDQVLALDDRLPLERVATVDALYAGSNARRRFATWLIGAFAGLALLLGVIGLYGVLSYTVAQRRQEIGIRMALGAGRSTVAATVLRQGLALALVGVAVGIAGALAMTRFLRSLLFGVSPTDPASIAAVAALVLAVAALAAWLPARRATRVDPAHVMRRE